MKCIRCGDEYEPQYWDLLGSHLLRGNGNCSRCCAVISAEGEAKEKVAHEQDIIKRRNNCIRLSGIPPKFIHSGFETFDKGWQDKALSFCRKYADEFPEGKRPFEYPSLYLWSLKSWGVGKTHLSCAIARQIFARWNGQLVMSSYGCEVESSCPQIYFVSEPDLFRQIQATYSYNREQERTKDSEDDILRKLTYCDLLVLDDVGKERRGNPDFIQRTLFGLIDGRYKLQLPMILTANLNADGLKKHLKDASFDRFFEMIQGKSACMDGDSYRRGRK